jgi:hypothetical protein
LSDRLGIAACTEQIHHHWNGSPRGIAVAGNHIYWTNVSPDPLVTGRIGRDIRAPPSAGENACIGGFAATGVLGDLGRYYRTTN